MTIRTRLPAPRFGIGALMVLVAGAGLGLWIVTADLRLIGVSPAEIGFDPHLTTWDAAGFLIVVGVLGGLSFVGVPLLLKRSHRRSSPRLWGPGRVLWFASGSASWLLWPPVIARRVGGGRILGDGVTGTCWAYGTPLMAVYVTASLLAGGWLRQGRRHRRRARPLPWVDRFGLVLGLLWAATGLYVLGLFYRGEFHAIR